MAKANRIVDPKANEQLVAASGLSGKSKATGNPNAAGESRILAVGHNAMGVVAAYVYLSG